MNDFVEIAKSFGLPVVFSLILIVAIYRVAKWAKPWIEKLFTAHLTLVSTLNETQVKQSLALVEISATLVELKEQSKIHTETLQEYKRAVNGIPHEPEK